MFIIFSRVLIRLWAKNTGPVSLWISHTQCSLMPTKSLVHLVCCCRCLCWEIWPQCPDVSGVFRGSAVSKKGPFFLQVETYWGCSRWTSRPPSPSCLSCPSLWTMSGGHQPCQEALPASCCSSVPSLCGEEPVISWAEGGGIKRLIWNKLKSLLCVALK